MNHCGGGRPCQVYPRYINTVVPWYEGERRGVGLNEDANLRFFFGFVVGQLLPKEV